MEVQPVEVQPVEALQVQRRLWLQPVQVLCLVRESPTQHRHLRFLGTHG